VEILIDVRRGKRQECNHVDALISAGRGVFKKGHVAHGEA
jgi:hypothetical protein